MANKKSRSGSRGGQPTYTPEAKERRARGQLSIRVSPELADQIRTAAASHPGGVSGWLADAARAQISKAP